MFNTWFKRPVIAANSSVWSPNDIPLVRARTVSVTTRLTYNGAATAGAKVHIYYSPDGHHWDTVAVDDYSPTFTAGATVQETYLAGVPEHGYLKVKVENQDAAQTITNVDIWYSIQSWPFRTEQEVGTIEKDIGEVK